MLILTGKNLGERQHEFNLKVNEAALNRVSFEDINEQTESSDLDKLFKIDLASKYRNIQYIIETLKSGDSLYISRALKCTWMYDDEFSNTINVDNLDKNVIPYMSIRMKKKLLSAISTHVRNEDRAAEFYKYCINEKLSNLALKFLNSTKDDFKLEIMKDKSNLFLVTSLEGENLKWFIRDSFKLAKAFIALYHESNRVNTFIGLSYLFSVSNEKYLDMLEESVKSNFSNGHLGLRISKDIMKKHKYRVLKSPSLYIGLISKSVLVRYSTANDAKIYLRALLPETVQLFWMQNYCNMYKYIIDIIPKGKFEFIKELFSSAYENEEFEMCLNFYNKQCYTLMTDVEKEKWALKQIESGNEILDADKDYIWYKFVNFDKAFTKIKKKIVETKDQTVRSEMLNILIESAKNPRDIEKLLNYYYEKHVNEASYIKENFLDRVFQHFDVFKFDNNCWSVLNKLFHSLQVYNMEDQYSGKGEYKIISLVYCIINKLEVHEALIHQIKTSLYFYTLKLITDKLSKNQQQMVYDYLFKVYMSEIEAYENVPYNDSVKNELRKYIHFTLDLLEQYGKTKDDCPELVNKFMKRDYSEFEFHRLFHATKKSEPIDLRGYLKTDANLLVKNLPQIKSNIDGNCYNLSQLLNKIKLYFPNDIAKDFLDFYAGLLKEDTLYYKNVQAATHGIFQLADETFKTDFMKEHAPKEGKIKHGDIDKKLLLIQQAICAHASYSRPPVAPEEILKYIKGDYVHFCLPTIYSYFANLPLPQCIAFVKALLDTPVSIQKHGIRLAFDCFSAENLRKLVLDAWQTKSVSLRNVIYKALYTKLIDGKNSQNVLFDTLKTITLTINENDDKEVFSYLKGDEMPKHLLSEYMEVVWKVVSQLPAKKINNIHLHSVLDSINTKFCWISQETIRPIVEEFVVSIFNEEDTKKTNTSEEESVIKVKWDLTANYILHAENPTDLDTKLEFTSTLINKCLGTKNDALSDTCIRFISHLENLSYYADTKYFKNIDVVMRSIKNQVKEILSIEVNYDIVLDLELGLVTRNVITETICDESGDATKKLIKPVALNFADGLGKLLKQYIDSGNYFSSLSNEITDVIRNKIEKFYYKFDMNTNELAVFVSVGLIEFDKPEIYLIVLDLLPPYYRPEYNGDFGVVLKRLLQLDNREIRCNLYKRMKKNSSWRSVKNLSGD